MQPDAARMGSLKDGEEITLTLTLHFDGDGYTARIGSASGYAAGIGQAASMALTKLRAEYDREAAQATAATRKQSNEPDTDPVPFTFLGKYPLDLWGYGEEYQMAVRFAEGESYAAIGSAYSVSGTRINQRLTRFERAVLHRVNGIKEDRRLKSTDAEQVAAWLAMHTTGTAVPMRSRFQRLLPALKPAE